jgi:hypothetical protein
MTFLTLHYGIRFRQVRDVILLSRILLAGVGIQKIRSTNTERSLISHGYKAIISRVLDIDIDKAHQRSNWGWTLNNHQINYAARDTTYLLRAYLRLRDMILEEGLLFSAQAECIALPVFVEMELNGFPIILPKAQELFKQYEDKKAELEKLFAQDCPFPYTQTIEVLAYFQKEFPELALETTGKDDLLPYLKDYPLFSTLLDLRTLNIAIRYIENVIDRAYGEPLAIRTFYNQLATSGTGRSSCSSTVSRSRPRAPDTGIQLQNPLVTPEHFIDQGLGNLRSMFGPDNAGKAEEDHEVLLVIDLPQAHNVIAAQMSKDRVLKDIFRTGKDAHIIMALQLAAIDGKKYTYDQFAALLKAGKKKLADFNLSGFSFQEAKKATEYRKAGKVGNYSGLNLGGKVRIAKALKVQDIPATLEDALAVQKAYRATYKDLYQFILGKVKEANRLSFDFSHIINIYGKPLEGKYGAIRGQSGRRKFALKSPSSFSGKDEVEASDISSFMWLSTEADLIKWAMGLILVEFDKHPEWGARFVNFAHDELDIVCLKRHSLEVAKISTDIVYRCMKDQCPDISFQIVKSGPEEVICENWSEK